MSVLNKIDKAAEAKGALVVKIWQFVKFIVVLSCGTSSTNNHDESKQTSC